MTQKTGVMAAKDVALFVNVRFGFPLPELQSECTAGQVKGSCPSGRRGV